jgi:hypothetical protein
MATSTQPGFKINRTRFEGLGYINQAKGLWRVVDIHDAISSSEPRCVGPQYKSKTELLADLERYARESWGYHVESHKLLTGAAREFSNLNSREQLKAVENWLGWQSENLAAGLKSPEDALKLYRGWLNDAELPEMADTDTDDEGNDMSAVRVRILGYDPLM